MNSLEGDGEKAVKASAIDLKGGVKRGEGRRLLRRSEGGGTAGVDRV